MDRDRLAADVFRQGRPQVNLEDRVARRRAGPWRHRRPASPRVLESEDTRSPDEVERDLIREANALSAQLFSETTTGNENDQARGVENTIAEEKKKTRPLLHEMSGTNPKYDAYLTLIQAIREQHTTLWVDKVYTQRFANYVPLAMNAAQQAGLTPTEIACAMQIGMTLGMQEKQTAKQESTKQPNEPPPNSINETSRPVVRLATQIRQGNVQLLVR